MTQAIAPAQNPILFEFEANLSLTEEIITRIAGISYGILFCTLGVVGLHNTFKLPSIGGPVYPQEAAGLSLAALGSGTYLVWLSLFKSSPEPNQHLQPEDQGNPAVGA